jgi:hypothetical protein
VQNMIYVLAASVPETRLQHQLGGWGSQAQVSGVFSVLLAAACILAVLFVLKKLLTS